VFLILTSADTEIQALAAALERLPEGFEDVRARNVSELSTAVALDRLIAEELPSARAVVLRVLGGRAYFAEGFERLSRECRASGIAFIALPGEQGLDPELTALCHAPLPLVTQVLEYFTQGGVPNLVNLLRCLSDHILMTGIGTSLRRPCPATDYTAPKRPRV